MNTTWVGQPSTFAMDSLVASKVRVILAPAHLQKPALENVADYLFDKSSASQN